MELQRTFDEMFFFLILLCHPWHLTGVSGTDMVKEVSVMEAESVTLHSNVTEVQRNDDIRWSFGAEGALLAFIDNKDISLTKVSEGRFKGRLQLDPQTGSLTINNITKTHSGPYQLSIKREENVTEKVEKFNLTVFSCLAVPVIIGNSSQCSLSSSSSSSSSQYKCSVVNVSAVSLSWYKGNSLLSSISVSDLSISLSLPLKVKYQENNTYRCVINNTFSNQTTYLVINTRCQPCSVHCCGFTEAVIRLAFSGLVGVATLAVLVYDITSTKSEQKRKEQASS